MSSDNTRGLFRKLLMPSDATVRTDILTPADVWGGADAGDIRERVYRYAPLLADYLADATEVINDLLDCARRLVSDNPPYVLLTDRLDWGSVVVTTWHGELRVGEVVWSKPSPGQRGLDGDATCETIVWWLSTDEAVATLGSDLCVIDTTDRKVIE